MSYRSVRRYVWIWNLDGTRMRVLTDDCRVWVTRVGGAR